MVRHRNSRRPRKPVVANQVAVAAEEVAIGFYRRTAR